MTILVKKRNEKCAMCGKKYVRRFSHQRYCGSEARKTGCAYIASRDRFRRINSRTKEYYSTLSTPKKRVKIRDKFTCKICLMVDETEGFMDVDHINGNHKDNREKNLQVLCPNCHRKKTIQDKVSPISPNK